MSKEMQTDNSEISLKDLINTLKLWVGIFWNNIILIIFTGMLGASAGYYFANNHKPVYKAVSRFIVKEGSPTGLASSLGNLGSLLGGSVGSSLDKTVAVIGSERIIGKVLLTPATIGDKKDLVINHFIRLGNLSESWEEDSILKKVKFEVIDTDPQIFNFPQRKIFKYALATFIGEKGIVGNSIDKKSGIVSLVVTHSDEYFAIEVNRLIYDELRSFFQDQATESADLNVAILTKKVDSINGELNIVRRQLARISDQSIGIFLNQDKVDYKSLADKEQILLSMYGEVYKNLESFSYMKQSASNSTVLKLLDFPFAPITPTSINKLTYAGFGFFLASILTFLFILIRRWYQNLMAS